jgi:hypothetical protein
VYDLSDFPKIAEVTVDESLLPLIKISSDPFATCHACSAGGLIFGDGKVTLSEARLAASSGCQNCELRLYGVQSVTRAFQYPPSDDLVTVASVGFDDNFIEVHVTDKQSLSQSHLPSRYYIKLFTLLGQPEIPIQWVRRGRDIVRTRRETYARIISEWLQACQ